MHQAEVLTIGVNIEQFCVNMLLDEVIKESGKSKCIFCGKRYQRVAMLKKHIESLHNSETENNCDVVRNGSCSEKEEEETLSSVLQNTSILGYIDHVT